MKKIILSVSFVSFLALSCKKTETGITVDIISPSDKLQVSSGQHIHFKANIVSKAELHEYGLAIIDTVSGDTSVSWEVHDHVTEITFDSSYTLPASKYRAIFLATDHEGTTGSGTRYFSIQ